MPNLATNSPDDVPALIADDKAPAPAGPRPVSCDRFYGGRFHLIQPKGWGHRAGLDPLLVAAATPASLAGRAADLGSGAGALAFALACRCPSLRLRLVEADAAMAALARDGLALPANDAFRGRLEVQQADILGGRAAREAAGLFDGRLDAVVTNPPFHPAGGRPSPDAVRQAARSARDAGFLTQWVRVGSALLRNDGLFACILRPENLRETLEAAQNRLGDLKILPVHPRADHPAVRVLVTARRGSRAPLVILPGITLHEEDGSPSPIALAVSMGEAELFPGN